MSRFQFHLFRKISTKLSDPIYIGDYKGEILSPIMPSTISVCGFINGVILHEENDIHKFVAKDNIVLVGSLYGENYLEGHAPIITKPYIKGKRGRKPKKKEKKRKIKGNGRYFSSQITFKVKSQVKDKKYYYFKVFRNGRFQVPGVLNKNLSDIYAPLNDLIVYLSKYYNNPISLDQKLEVKIRNCKTSLIDNEISINTKKLGEIILNDMDMYGNNMKISSCNYISNKSKFKTTIKFSRPIAKNPERKTTLKILKHKIGFEGAITEIDIDLIFRWLSDILLFYYNEVIIDPLFQDNEIKFDESDFDIQPEKKEIVDIILSTNNEYAEDPYMLDS